MKPNLHRPFIPALSRWHYVLRKISVVINQFAPGGVLNFLSSITGLFLVNNPKFCLAINKFLVVNETKSEQGK